MKLNRLVFRFSILFCLLITFSLCWCFSLENSYSIKGWILLDEDLDYYDWVLERAYDFGINHLQISHSWIMDIDQILESKAKEEQIRLLCQKAHSYGLKAYVWAHEFRADSRFFCFNGSSDSWEKRANAYRQALSLVPEIDGVILMFGSADVEPWYAFPSCQTEPELLSIPGRVERIIRTVYGVVRGEFGKELFIRTFIHMPWELSWTLEAIRNCDDLDFIVMSKPEPHDFEPYFPLEPSFGKIGNHLHIIEYDLAGEYWGVSMLPFCCVGYIKDRLLAASSAGNVIGASGRLECGSFHAFGTPNEVNIYALSRLLDEPSKSIEEIYHEFIINRYNLPPQSPAIGTLTTIFENTFDIGRKMYYVKGEWAFTKGSEFPPALWENDISLSRSIMKWDEDYRKKVVPKLINPDAQTIKEIAQEKFEAFWLSMKNLQLLESIEIYLSVEDYQDLYHRLLHQHYATLAWWRLAEITYCQRGWMFSKDKQFANWLEYSLDRLEDTAAQIALILGPNTFPGRPSVIQNFVDTTRAFFNYADKPEPIDFLKVFDITSEVLSPTSAIIRWKSEVPATSQVEYGTELPEYGSHSHFYSELTTDHQVILENLTPGTRYVFRVLSKDTNGNEIASSDYILRTPSAVCRVY